MRIGPPYFNQAPDGNKWSNVPPSKNRLLNGDAFVKRSFMQCPYHLSNFVIARQENAHLLVCFFSHKGIGAEFMVILLPFKSLNLRHEFKFEDAADLLNSKQ